MENKVRNLDVVTSSMGKIELNNLVVSMRPTVNHCRRCVIQKLTRQIKAYSSSKGPEPKVEKLKRKAERLQSLLDAVKKLDADQTAKYCLINTTTLSEAAKLSDETKAMVNIGCEKRMQKLVTKWREEHKDWRSLAAFLGEMVSRRMSRKKKKGTLDVEANVDRSLDGEEGMNGMLVDKEKKEMLLKEAEEGEEEGSSEEEDEDDEEDSEEVEEAEEENNESCGNGGDDDGVKVVEEVKMKSSKEGKATRIKSISTESVVVKSTTNPSELVPKVKKPPKPKNPAAIVRKLNMENWDKVEGEISVDVEDDADPANVLFIGSEKSTSNDQKPKRKLGSLFIGFEDDDDDDTGRGDGGDDYVDDDRSNSCVRDSKFVGSLSGKRQHNQHGGYSNKWQETGDAPKWQDRGKSWSQPESHFKQPSTVSPADEDEVNEKLHPSWQASKKRKMESRIQIFKGTKKTFNDDD